MKFEQLVEEAVDLDAVPEEYLIDANYDAKLKVRGPCCFSARMDVPLLHACVSAHARGHRWHRCQVW